MKILSSQNNISTPFVKQSRYLSISRNKKVFLSKVIACIAHRSQIVLIGDEITLLYNTHFYLIDYKYTNEISFL